jgi:pyrrolidone-carboxylate peptidase
MEILPGGPDEYASHLSRDLRQILKAAGVAFASSESAGQFLCEETFYTGLRLASPERAGFLHLPPYPRGDRDASDPDNRTHLENLEHAVRSVLKGLVDRNSAPKERAV